MTLGALIVLVGLVVAGVYLPKRGKAGERAPQTTATDTTAANPTSPEPVATPPANGEPTPAPPAVTEGSGTPAENPATPQPPVVMAKESSKIQNTKVLPRNYQEGGSSATTSPAAPAASGPDIHQLEDEIDQLTARAGAVNSSLDRLKQQQASAGYGLRGDISERQAAVEQTRLMNRESESV